MFVMKKSEIIIASVALMLMVSAFSFGQDKKSTKAAPLKKDTKPLLYKYCNPPADSNNTHEIAIADVLKWAPTQPLEVTCDGKTTVELYQFQIQIISKDPLQTIDYGTGEAGIPILAINALKRAKPGDTVFLKNVTFKERTSREVLKLPNIVFTLK
jgi:hypothetical protein